MSKVTITLEEMIRLKSDARGFSFLPRQPVSSLLAGRHASRLRGRGLAFEELRHYQQGDDIRTIDWKATARLRSPYVRVYNEERERPVLFVVDQRRPMFFGSQRAMKSVAAAEVAALGAWRALASGDRVGGIVFNENEIVDLSPHRSQSRVLRVFHEIVRLNELLPDSIHNNTAPVTIGLNSVLEAALRRAKHDHLIVLISDFSGADAESHRLITRLSAHNDVLAIAAYDPLGASLVGQPGMSATHAGQTLPIPEGAAFAESFGKVFEQLLERWMQIFRSLRVPVIPISTAEPPADQIRELFGARQHHEANAP